MCRLRSKQKMMSPSHRSTCCLLLLIVLVHQTTSLSVKKLCEIRCLHGRGGVLCHCNAMHFTGKRSGPIRHNYNSRPDNKDFGGLADDLQGSVHVDMDRLSPQYMLNQNGDDILGDSWDGTKLEDFVSELKQGAGSDIIKGMDDTDQSNQDDRGTHPPLPFLRLSHPRDEVREEDMARSNAASQVKQLMGAPYLAEELGFDSDGDNSNSENVKASPGVKQHLRRLEGILQNALQGR